MPRADAVALTKALVASDSQNPSLVSGGAGEAAVARDRFEDLQLAQGGVSHRGGIITPS